METTQTPRFIVHDRLLAIASELITPSARSTRYWVIDTETREVIDEYASKRAAQMHVKQLNA